MTPVPDVTHVSDSVVQSAQAVGDPKGTESEDANDSRHPKSSAISDLL